ncbi:MAG: hypothetical protein AAGF44_00695 [Pseudomonadota bacterium]
MVETSEIGTNLITVTGAAGQSNVLPAPDRLRPMIAAMDALIKGEIAALESHFALILSPDPDGWQVVMAEPKGGAPLLRLTGCGAVILALHLPEDDGIKRIFHFGPE